MKKRIERIGLSVLLVLALVSVSNATLSMDLSGSSMDIGGAAIVITIHSDVSEAITWGIYLDPTSEYPTNAQLQNAQVLKPNAGGTATVIGADPGAGHNYQSKGKQANAPIADTDWSTVEFVGLALGTYTVRLYDSWGTTGNVLDTETVTVVVPEPATIALLGLGGMFLLRRRR